MTTHSSPSPVVLVPGAWLGAWAFDQVAEQLRAAGHDVHAHTLPGMAEREDEDHPGLDVSDHIDDLVSLLLERDLHDVVLVGHSYAGAVVTGAAARVPQRIARLVHLDASVPVDDGPLAVEGSPEREGMAAAAQAFDGRRMDLLPDALLTSHDMFGADDLTPAQLATFCERATPFPLACMTAPLPAREDRRGHDRHPPHVPALHPVRARPVVVRPVPAPSRRHLRRGAAGTLADVVRSDPRGRSGPARRSLSVSRVTL